MSYFVYQVWVSSAGNIYATAEAPTVVIAVVVVSENAVACRSGSEWQWRKIADSHTSVAMALGSWMVVSDELLFPPNAA